MDFNVARFLRSKAEAGKYEHYARWFEDVLVENSQWAHVEIGPSAGLFLFQTWGAMECFLSTSASVTSGNPSAL